MSKGEWSLLYPIKNSDQEKRQRFSKTFCLSLCLIVRWGNPRLATVSGTVIGIDLRVDSSGNKLHVAIAERKIDFRVTEEIYTHSLSSVVTAAWRSVTMIAAVMRWPRATVARTRTNNNCWSWRDNNRTRFDNDRRDRFHDHGWRTADDRAWCVGWCRGNRFSRSRQVSLLHYRNHIVVDAVLVQRNDFVDTDTLLHLSLIHI